MLIDIQSMFKDIIETPQQRRAAMQAQGEQQAQTAVGSLSGAGRLLAPLIAQLARQQPERSEALQRGLGGMLNAIPGVERETRTPSQQLQAVLGSSNTSTAAGLEKTAQEVEKLGYGVEAASIRQQVKEKQKAEVTAQDKKESLIMMVRDSELTSQQKGMLFRSINADPSQDPNKLISTIVSMGGEGALSAEARTLKWKAEQMGLVPGSAEYKAYIARNGGEEGTGGDTANARERKIADYMKTFGIPRGEAIQRIEADTIIDPTTGQLIQQNLQGDGGFEIASVNIPSSQRVVGEAPSIDINQIVFDPAKAGGIVTGLQNLWNVTAGQIPFLDIPSDRTQAQQQLRFLDRDAILALASSERPAVVEQERIGELLPQPGEWFQNPRESREKVVSFIDVMTQQYVDDLRYVSDPSVSRAVKRDVNTRINSVERIIRRVMTPEAADTLFEAVEGFEEQRNTILEMPRDELNNLDISSLSLSELDVLEERLRNE